jgi:hypothetical protein
MKPNIVRDEGTSDLFIKAIAVKGSHARKMAEMMSAFQWSARRLACFVLAYDHNIETVLLTPRFIYRQRGGLSTHQEKINVFIPMTGQQSNFAHDLSKDFDFTTMFKISLDKVYDQFKNGKLELNKTELTSHIASNKKY